MYSIVIQARAMRAYEDWELYKHTATSTLTAAFKWCKNEAQNFANLRVDPPTVSYRDIFEELEPHSTVIHLHVELPHDEMSISIHRSDESGHLLPVFEEMTDAD